MATIREIRLAMGYSQRAFAARIDIPLQTYRPLDSGRRSVPSETLEPATRAFQQHGRATELFKLDALADEYGMHPRTLRAAARDGRLQVQFSNRVVYGRPLRLASRAAVDDFIRLHYRQRYSRCQREPRAAPASLHEQQRHERGDRGEADAT